MRRYVRVVATGYLLVDEAELQESYQANTFEEAVDNQRAWYEDDPGLPFQEYVTGEADITFELMPEDFDPEK